jgi:recombination protein RecT
MAQQRQNTQLAKSPISKLKAVISVDSVQEQFRNALKENADAFIASVIDLYGGDSYLQKCQPKDVITECLKAATLKLPINKNLGFAWIVPYGNKPQFQIGYRGYIQLAMRTGQYKYINAGGVYEGVAVEQDLLTGAVEFTGKATSDKIAGYFAYFELLNGFSKAVYMTADEMLAHAKRYSKSFNNKSSAWQTNFDEMAYKTCIRQLLSKYGFLSTEMISALSADQEVDVETRAESEIKVNANSEIIDITPEVVDEPMQELEQGQEPEQEQNNEQMSLGDGPEF